MPDPPRPSTPRFAERRLTDAAGQTARLPDVADLAAPFQLSRPTTRDYVTLLARVFLLEPLPPWQTNRLSRPVKTPKLHLSDTGLACALLATDAATLGAVSRAANSRRGHWRSADPLTYIRVCSETCVLYAGCVQLGSARERPVRRAASV